MSEEPVMYIIVNKEVKMSPGKLAAQVAHSAVKASHEGYETGWWDSWYQGSYTKIILKASKFEMQELMNKYYAQVSFTLDEGRTEIPKGTLTTLAFIPMLKSEAPPELAKLKLL
jgi:PTH2 family peptidyl-tRNA hydrolase